MDTKELTSEQLWVLAMSQLQPIFHPEPRLSYFLDTRETVCPDAFVVLRERGLIGGAGPNAAIWRPTLAGLDLLGKHADIVKEAIVTLTFAGSRDRDAMVASVRASSLP